MVSKLAACFILMGLGNAAYGSNEKCPVLPNIDASADISATYQGKEVRFCCNECRSEFLNNPEIYVSEVPQLQELGWREHVGLYFDANSRFIVSGILATTLVVLRILRLKRPASASTEPRSRLARLFTRKISATIPLVIACGILGFEVYSLRGDLEAHALEDQIHFATFYDFGYPPVPKRPDVENRLQSTFYRGNDERSPKLFNNGAYRTATFHLSVVNQDGRPINIGDKLGDQRLFVRFEVERPPFTPDFLYSERLMSKMFLTRECDKFLAESGVPDRVDLTMIEDMQRWEALYPLDHIAADGQARGIIYVNEEYYHPTYWWSSSKQWIGSRFHYGISFRLATRDGRVTDESDLYMGSLYRTRKFPNWKVPLSEWFSHEPIPELPYAPNTDDPELLGIDDYE
ncbi:MAG: hypothetical protein O3A00_18135 [Planctomycetota bacterium]|nr:hypothetical protein [Planctomycetota bacterium]